MEPAGIVILAIFGCMILYLIVSRVVEARKKKTSTEAEKDSADS
ncbi:MAG: hypothetical protein SO014_02920 [Candidatus Limivicinus sp.]|nr:hypothetical protein [Clostridiales bacterium]MDY3859580.1 hypothetical protein [Candidatus Limivicinus sp.]